MAKLVHGIHPSMSTYAALTTNPVRLDLIEPAIGPLMNKIDGLRRRLIAAGIQDSDGRHASLSGMEQVLAGIMLTFHAIAGCHLTPPRTFDQVLESFDRCLTVPPKMALELAATHWCRSLLTLFHFKLDVLCQDLLTALGKAPGKSGFGQNIDALIKAITIPDPGSARDRLRTITAIRNTLHNNGIHRDSNFSITIDSISFEFKQNMPVTCASLGHILTGLAASIDVVDSILFSPEIASIATVVNLFNSVQPVP